MSPMNDSIGDTGGERDGIIDVQWIVDDIRDRVEHRRLTDRTALRSFGRVRTELQPGRVVLRPEVTASGRRGIGTMLSATKRIQLRLIWPLLMDLVVQANAALDVNRLTMAAETRRRGQLERRVADLERRLQDLDARLPAETIDQNEGRT